jgi:predicted CXXCH cytochrome family protein
MKKSILVTVVIGFFAALAFSPTAVDASDCAMCHASLAENKVVHAPVSAGFCFMCHDGLDSSQIPHVITSKTALGLSYEGEQLCLACHERSEYLAKEVHASIGSMQCTTCHNPHASENSSLLR